MLVFNSVKVIKSHKYKLNFNVLHYNRKCILAKYVNLYLIKVLKARANRIYREYISSELNYLVGFYRRLEIETQRKDAVS